MAVDLKVRRLRKLRKGREWPTSQRWVVGESKKVRAPPAAGVGALATRDSQRTASVLLASADGDADGATGTLCAETRANGDTASVAAGGRASAEDQRTGSTLRTSADALNDDGTACRGCSAATRQSDGTASVSRAIGKVAVCNI